MKDLYQDQNCRVFTNGSGEIFVKLNNARVAVRITPNYNNVVCRQFEGRMEVDSFGHGGVRISEK